VDRRSSRARYHAGALDPEVLIGSPDDPDAVLSEEDQTRRVDVGELLAAQLLQLALDCCVMRQVQRQQALKQEAAELEKKIATLQASATSLKTMATDLDLIAQDFSKWQIQSDGDIKLVVSAMPPEAELSRVSRSGRETVIKGVSQGEVPVLDYARGLRSSGRFSAVVVSSLQETDQGLSFSLTLTSLE